MPQKRSSSEALTLEPQLQPPCHVLEPAVQQDLPFKGVHSPRYQHLNKGHESVDPELIQPDASQKRSATASLHVYACLDYIYNISI